MRSLFRLSAFLTLAIGGLASGSASAMPMWAHGIDPLQHLYLLRIVFVVGVMAFGALLGRGLEETWRWIGHHAR